MQENKISKIIAQKLKQSQETEPQPYDLGAWEAFGQYRGKSTKPSWFWLGSGIAASIAVGAIGFFVYLSELKPNDQVSDQTLVSSSSNNAENSNVPEANSSSEKPSLDSIPDGSLSSPLNKTPTESSDESLGNKGNQRIPDLKSNLAGDGKTNSDLIAKYRTDNGSQNQNIDKRIMRQFDESFQLLSRNPLKDFNSSNLELPQVLAALENPSDLSVKKDEFDFPPILPEDKNLSLGLGVSPGFGASQQNGNASANSSLGMGLLVAMDLPGKLTVGSGLGINLFSQENQIQTPPNMAFASSMSPVQEQLMVRQTQLDIPVFFQYPVTTNQSISVQAGFSNFISLNQVSELESSFTRQVPVSGQDALLSNSFQLRSESVVQTQQLASPSEGKFYPFATMNFGVNLRVMQSKNTDYILMPFYHLPVNQFTGFGDNPSFFGAAFKVRFGGIDEE